MSTPTESPNPKTLFKSPIYVFGFLVMVAGAAFTGGAIANQLKNTIEGRNYYDWMAIGIAIAIVGFVLARIARRRNQNA